MLLRKDILHHVTQTENGCEGFLYSILFALKDDKNVL